MNGITTNKANCKKCGAEFDSTAATFALGGSTLCLRQSYCDPCQRLKEAQIEAQTRGSDAPPLKWSEICPAAYQGFDLNRLPEASRGVAFNVLNWQKSEKGVGMIGDSRAGKTFIMHELARRVFERGGKIKLTSGTEFAYACGSSEAGERRAMIDSCIAVAHLFLDDIDKMKMTDRVESDFYHVIEQRRRALKPVFVTLNASGAELERMMSDNGGSPIVNRLRHDVCEFYAI